MKSTSIILLVLALTATSYAQEKGQIKATDKAIEQPAIDKKTGLQTAKEQVKPTDKAIEQPAIDKKADLETAKEPVKATDKNIPSDPIISMHVTIFLSKKQNLFA